MLSSWVLVFPSSCAVAVVVAVVSLGDFCCLIIRNTASAITVLGTSSWGDVNTGVVVVVFTFIASSVAVVVGFSVVVGAVAAVEKTNLALVVLVVVGAVAAVEKTNLAVFLVVLVVVVVAGILVSAS